MTTDDLDPELMARLAEAYKEGYMRGAAEREWLAAANSELRSEIQELREAIKRGDLVWRSDAASRAAILEIERLTRELAWRKAHPYRCVFARWRRSVATW